jgi:hypothetical protein
MTHVIETRAEPEQASSASVERMLLALLSLAAATIHVAVMEDHFAEFFAFGVFFAAVAWLQVAWAVGILVAPSRPLLWAAVVGNVVVVVVWVVSRTTGLPFGPEPGVAEAAGFLDVFSTILELVLAAGAGVLLVQRGSEVLVAGRAAVALVVGVGLLLGALTAIGIAREASRGSGGHGGTAEEHGAEAEHALGLGDANHVPLAR